MTGDGRTRVRRSEACRKMAELLQRELHIVLTPEEIDGLFTRQWAHLSLLGHAIHGGLPDYQPTAAIEAAGRYQEQPL